MDEFLNSILKWEDDICSLCFLDNQYCIKPEKAFLVLDIK